MMAALITTLSTGVPKPLQELITLGRTLKKRAADVLAYFDRPGTSNGPTEAINGRLEHLRGSALGFRNLTNYIARSLLETGGFRPQLHPQIMKSRIRATLNPNAVRIAPACADRKTAEFMVKPPCSSYLSRPGGALARCELYAKCLRHRSPDTPEFAPKFKRKKRFQCP